MPLIAALVLQLTFPLHLHLHHTGDTGPLSGHAVTLHILSDGHEMGGHHFDDETHELDAIPDVTTKKPDFKGLNLPESALLLIRLPLSQVAIVQESWINDSIFPRCCQRINPPTRAPPAPPLPDPVFL